MTIKYSKVGKTEYIGYFDENGDQIREKSTELVEREGLFGWAVLVLVKTETGKNEGVRIPDILMTTEEHWDGMSEFTITNEWSQIVLTVPEWNWEKEWP